MSTALISILAVLLGAFAQHFFGRRAARHSHRLDARDRAYTDFCTAFTKLIAIQRIGDQAAEFEQIANVNDAKVRICIFGEEEVVHNLGAVHADGIRHATKGEMEALTTLFLSIRRSLGIKDASSVRDAIFHSFVARHDDAS